MSYKCNGTTISDSTDLLFKDNPIYDEAQFNQLLDSIPTNGDFYAFEWGKTNVNNVQVKEIILGAVNNTSPTLMLALATSKDLTTGSYAIVTTPTSGATFIATAFFSYNEPSTYKSGSVDGTLVVSKLDNVNHRVSGTFNFTESYFDTTWIGETIHYTISEGVFHNIPFQQL
jgi:hypothetical protein